MRGIELVGVDIIAGVVQITVDGGYSESYTFDELFDIDETNLTREMAQHSSRFGRIAVWLGKAEYVESIRKQEKETEYGIVDNAIREEFAESKAKITEGIVKAAVLTDEQYITVASEYDRASAVATMFKHILNGMKNKSDMLISIGAQLRAEMSMTGMIIKDDYDKSVDNLKEVLSHKKKQV